MGAAGFVLFGAWRAFDGSLLGFPDGPWHPPGRKGRKDDVPDRAAGLSGWGKANVRDLPGRVGTCHRLAAVHARAGGEGGRAAKSRRSLGARGYQRPRPEHSLRGGLASSVRSSGNPLLLPASSWVGRVRARVSRSLGTDRVQGKNDRHVQRERNPLAMRSLRRIGRRFGGER
jgi:hypothetical protein